MTLQNKLGVAFFHNENEIFKEGVLIDRQINSLIRDENFQYLVSYVEN